MIKDIPRLDRGVQLPYRHESSKEKETFCDKIELRFVNCNQSKEDSATTKTLMVYASFTSVQTFLSWAENAALETGKTNNDESCRRRMDMICETHSNFPK